MSDDSTAGLLCRGPSAASGHPRKSPHAVLLLDEIERAHPDMFNILLQVIDDATLTDSHGRKADFRHVILIMTTNAGGRGQSDRRLGFMEPGALGTGEIERVVDKQIDELRAMVAASTSRSTSRRRRAPGWQRGLRPCLRRPPDGAADRALGQEAAVGVAAVLMGIRRIRRRCAETIAERAGTFFRASLPVRRATGAQISATVDALDELTRKRAGEVLAKLIDPATARVRSVLLTGREHNNAEITPTFTDRDAWKKTRKFIEGFPRWGALCVTRLNRERAPGRLGQAASPRSD